MGYNERGERGNRYADSFTLQMMKGKIVIISGWRGSGKTMLCEQLVRTAQGAGWNVAGVLSPAHFEGGEKMGIEAEDLRTGERRMVARRARPDEDTHCSSTPAWVFDEKQMAWGDAVLRSATPCDLLVVDELGPLELLDQEGWQSGIEVLDGGAFRLAVVVVRPELIDKACERWQDAEIVKLGGSMAEVRMLAKELGEGYFCHGNGRKPSRMAG